MKKISKSKAYVILKYAKIYVGTQEVSEMVQKQLFKAGFIWRFGGAKEVRKIDIMVLSTDDSYIDYDNTISAFKKIEKREYSAMEILSWYIVDDLSINLKFKDDVLVRNSEDEEWAYSVYSHFSDGDFKVINGMTFTQCIPFEGNEDLVGTTNNPKEGEQ